MASTSGLQNNAARKLFKDVSSSESDLFSDDSDADPIYLPEETSEDEDNAEQQNGELDVLPRAAKEVLRCPSPKPSPAKLLKSRKRKISLSKKERNKARRNEGREYNNVKNKLVPGRVIGNLCQCPLKCSEKLSMEKNTIFDGFWNLSNFDKQNAYLFGCIKPYNVKRRYTQKLAESRRQKSFYFAVNIAGKQERICKVSFLAVHGLQHSKGRINNILNQLKSSPTPKTDARGKHSTRPNCIPDAQVQAVHTHITSIPKYQSHYSRAQNPNRVYLDSNLNITTLYCDHFLKFCEENNIKAVKEDKYRRIFCEHYNIAFKLPKSDTCKTCDELHILKSQAKSEEEKSYASTKHELHLRRADAVRDKLKEMTTQAKEHPEKVHVITVDLQQTLPTPKLSCGPAFYLRKLWTYNVGVHDCGTGIGHMFMWDESVAARGSDEIGSCLLKYIRNIQSEKLVIFSDNCGGQNKNYNLMALYLYIIRLGHFSEIEHYYLTSRHTFLPSDRDFAKIEKYHQKCEPNVWTPDHWKEIITKCCRKHQFFVTKLTREEIYDLSNLRNNINTSKNTCELGQSLKFNPSNLL